MSQLRAQSIAKLCRPTKWFGLLTQQPMIVPFRPEKIVIRGLSAGLSATSYDVSIAHDLILAPSPAYVLRDLVKYGQCGWQAQDVIDAFKAKMIDYPPSAALAHTVEDFYMPHNVVAYVDDKSTFARGFTTAFNTLIDPGFCGNLTVELANLGEEILEFKAGDPLCQIVFVWLDGATDRPYRGKYQHQTKAAHPARYEHANVD